MCSFPHNSCASGPGAALYGHFQAISPRILPFNKQEHHSPSISSQKVPWGLPSALPSQYIQDLTRLLTFSTWTLILATILSLGY